jgi:hypothetical protein
MRDNATCAIVGAVMHLSYLFILAFAVQEQARPLPDAEEFRAALPGIVQVRITSVQLAIFHRDFLSKVAEYNYTEKETVITRDPRSGVEKTETKVYDINRGPEEWQVYRREISRNGSPVTDQERERQDNEHRRFENAVRAVQARSDARPDSTKKQEEAKLALETQAYENDLFAMYDIRVLGRERHEDLPVILLELKPRPRYKPKTEVGELWQDTTMRVWIREDDREVVRLTAVIGDERDLGIAVIEKGATLSVERRKINDEVWLPIRTEITKRRPRTNGRLGPPERVITEFSDFKKFTVDAVIRPASVLP